MNSKFRRSVTGQTIIELIVTLSVIVGLISILIIYNRTGQRVVRVPRAAEKLAFDLRRAQNYALTVREFAGEIPCAYGIHFDVGQNQYILFADLLTGSDCTSANGQRAPGGSEDVEAIKMEEGVIVMSSTNDVSDIVFVPPSATVSFFPSFPVGPASITLGFQGGIPSITKTVRVNRVGRVNVVVP